MMNVELRVSSRWPTPAVLNESIRNSQFAIRHFR